MFIEMMTHIITIENILMANYNISSKTLNKALDLNKESIREQLNKIERRDKDDNNKSK